MPQNLTREQVAAIEQKVQDEVVASGKVPDREAYNRMVDAAVDAAYQSQNTFGANFVRSGKQFVGDLAHMLTPSGAADTVQNIARMAGAGALKVARKGAEAVGSPFDPTTAGLMQGFEKPIDAVGEYYKNRYGGLENVKTTAYEDPVGFLADLSSVASAGAGTVGKLAQVAKVAGAGKVASGLGKVARVGRSAASVTDPVSLAAGAAKLPLGAFLRARKDSIIKGAIADQHSAFKFTPTAKARNAGRDLGKVALETETVPTRASQERLWNEVSGQGERFDRIVDTVAGSEGAPRVFYSELKPTLRRSVQDYSEGLFKKSEGAGVARGTAREVRQGWKGFGPMTDEQYLAYISKFGVTDQGLRDLIQEVMRKRQAGGTTVDVAPSVRGYLPSSAVGAAEGAAVGPASAVAGAAQAGPSVQGIMEALDAAGVPRPVVDHGINLTRGNRARKKGLQVLRQQAANWAKSGNEVPASWDVRHNTYGKMSGLVAAKADPIAQRAGLLAPGESLKDINRRMGDRMALATSMDPVVSRLENRDIFSLGAKILASNALSAVTGRPMGAAKAAAMGGLALQDNPIFKSNKAHMWYAGATKGPDAMLERVFPKMPGSGVGPLNEAYNFILPNRSMTMKSRVNEAQEEAPEDLDWAAMMMLMKSDGSTEKP